MIGFNPKRQTGRYYLYPGHGGHSWRRKRRWMLVWSVAVGLVVSMVLAVVMYYVGKT